MILPDINQLFLDHGEKVTLETGDVLFRQGDASDNVYLLKSGILNVYVASEKSSPVLVNSVAEGSLVGELGAITRHPRTATIIAGARAVLFCLSTSQFRTYLADNLAMVETMTLTNREHLISADTNRVHFENTFQQMQKRVASLGEEKEQLTELLRLREELEAMVVHDLRNPLNSIVIALSLLEPLKDQVQDKDGFLLLLRLARGGTQRMLNLISALLDIARLESGMLALNFSEFDLSSMIDEVIATQQALVTVSSIELISRMSSGLRVRADRDVLVRVLANLLDNAIKFAPRSSSIAVAAGLLEDGTVRITVTDEGPGIPPEDRERIFEKFTRVKDAEHQRRSGTGLGLTFCRMAVEAHGGSIRVEEGPSGAGSCFVVHLPGT